MINKKRMNKIEEKLQLRNVIKRLPPEEERIIFESNEIYKIFTRDMNIEEKENFNELLIEKISEREKTDVFSSDLDYQRAIMFGVMSCLEKLIEPEDKDSKEYKVEQEVARISAFSNKEKMEFISGLPGEIKDDVISRLKELGRL